MHSFAETAPEINTATVKQVAELVKIFTKKKESMDKNFLPPHRILDTRIEKCYLHVLADLFGTMERIRTKTC
jgi:hypothetical protein